MQAVELRRMDIRRGTSGADLRGDVRRLVVELVVCERKAKLEMLAEVSG